jgi:hypothetical protein
MGRALARRLAAVSAVGLFVLASCEALLLFLLFVFTNIDDPLILFENMYFENGVLYFVYEYADGSYELVAASGNHHYSQRFDPDGKLVEVIDEWPGDNPNHHNPYFPDFVDPAKHGLPTSDMQSTGQPTITPRGRSDASRGNPDEQKEEEQEQQESTPPSEIPSEGSSEGSSLPG